MAKKCVIMGRILVGGVLLAEVSASLGQGEVDFENFNNSFIYINSVHNGPATGIMSGPGGSYYFALLMGFTNATSIDATLDNGTSLANGGWVYETLGKNTGTPGLLDGNDDPNGPGALIVGGPSGYPENFAVVGWSANIGTTYAEAKAWWNNGNPNSGPSGYFGISGIAQDVVVGGADVPIPTIFGPTPVYEITGFTLNLYEVGPITPFLNIAPSSTNVVLSWNSIPGFTVEYATNLPATSWISNSSPVFLVGGRYTVTNRITGAATFYRLKR